MKTTLLPIAMCLILSGPALALTDEECASMWKQADLNSDGTLTGAEADRYAAWMRLADKTIPEDGVVTPTIFLENCKADVFVTAATEEGAPLKGANSFTENQARDRALAAGFSNVSALTKDADGIWRGTATRDGQTVNIAVDYKGNVVAG